MSKLPIALQLYSLRALAAKDFVATLELTAALGYAGVEFAGYGGLTSSELKDELARLGLTAVSTHVSFEQLQENLTAELEFNREIGNTKLVCPVPPKGFTGSAENYRKFAKDMNQLGAIVSDQGFKLGYHNHSFEFEKYDGVYGLDIFYDNVDPKYVFTELDLGWTLHGGEDPAGYLEKFKGRCPLVHIKDFDAGNEQTDVGDGILDLPRVLATAKEVGVEWLILETEVYGISPIHSVKAGLANLKTAQAK